MTALLFDQNLSPRLVSELADTFPRSLHVSQIGLAEALDRAVWDTLAQISSCSSAKMQISVN